ncbi:MAG TPA: DNA-processing protein DprA [Solirubrobacteraceae bacterium]|nr:DNA-processing protein DprA [Solirubrobacteraceae bacterium]
MTAADERAAMVALLRTGRRPWVEYAELIEERGSVADVLEEELGPGEQTTLFPEHGTGPKTGTGPEGKADPDRLLRQARADLEHWSAQGMHLVTVLDRAYPPNLRAVHDRPPMVFIAGHLTHADARGVAVVGARQATRAGTDRAREIANHLVDHGYTVVSGLAAGIDTAAHTAALSKQGRTVAVVGTGLARQYPPENRTLQRQIASECAVVSQFWPDSPPSRRSFPMRNAVMSGIALATVVVEASDTSGARTQARLALAQGRPVFLLASLVERQQWAREYAARPGTHVVREPRDITTVVERLISPGSLVV